MDWVKVEAGQSEPTNDGWKMRLFESIVQDGSPRPIDEAQIRQAESFAPSVPETIEHTGVDFGFLTDLTLKTVYSYSSCTTQRAAEKLRLPISLAERLLQHLYHEHLVDIRETLEFQNRRYAILDRGMERVRRLLDVNAYIGPAPVSLGDYTRMLEREEKARELIDSERIRQASAGLILPDSTIDMLGVVANSRRSLFLTGPPGNGKTSIAKALHAALGGEIWIPYAIDVDGQIIQIFDSYNHEAINLPPAMPYDRRWTRIRRPLVIVGGELTIEAMDLTYNRAVKFYEAPFQMKSNGGALLIDDFGRQRLDWRDLLNRWIIPLESRVDYLTLHTGKKVQVPFEQLLIFATNLNVNDLADQAFLRRVGYRLAVHPPSAEAYVRIFQRYAQSRGLTFDPKLVEELLSCYTRERREMKCCDPGELIERSLDICRCEQRPQKLTSDILERAWKYYLGD